MVDVRQIGSSPTSLLGMLEYYAARALIDEEYEPASRKDIPRVAAVVARVWFRPV